MKMCARMSALLLLAVAACGGSGATDPAASSSPASGQTTGTPPQDGGTAPTPPITGGGGAGGGGGGGGGGVQIPPPPTIDGAAWFINNATAVIVPAPNIDFGALKNTVQGAIAIGDTRTASLFVYNTSKKTALVVSDISIVGDAAQDFSISPASLAAALNVSIPANKSAAAILQVTFTATAEGVRAATLQLVSNAGVALVSLSGVGLPARPILAANTAALSFLPTSAFATITVTNQGGDMLILQSIDFAGANPGSFQFFVANRGFSNCYAGIPLGPSSSCFIGVGPVAGTPAPASAGLVLGSNDPVNPQTDIQLDLTAAP